MTLTRPAFLPPVDTSLLNQLIAGTYFNALRLAFGAGEYLGWGQFQLTNDPNSAVWVPRRGTYNTLVGYWIFKPTVNQCWQAVGTNGPLAYWNADGQAQGPPQDWELFIFELVDQSSGAVRVRNIYGRYVRFDPNGFQCDASLESSATFYVEFC